MPLNALHVLPPKPKPHGAGKAGSMIVLDEADLLVGGINAAIGVGTIESAYTRTISLALTRRRASGYVDADLASTCFWYVPVVVERKAAGSSSSRTRG